jgi:hypothetical protein
MEMISVANCAGTTLLSRRVERSDWDSTVCEVLTASTLSPLSRCLFVNFFNGPTALLRRPRLEGPAGEAMAGVSFEAFVEEEDLARISAVF